MNATKRSPRFKRVKQRAFRLTERDLAIIEGVYRHRLLDSEHVARLVGGSSQNIRRRLQLLYHAGYLDRPAIQVADFKQDPRSLPMAYALGNRGATLLMDHWGLDPGAVNWTAKNRKLRSIFLRHTLMVSGIMVAFEAACRESGQVRLILWKEILETKCPPQTRNTKRPQTWRVRVPRGGYLGITPDAIFGLHFLKEPEGANRAYFYLEADRGTMPVTRTTLKQTAIYKKLATYHATALQSIHTKRFGIKTFRVLTITKSPDRKRVDSMVQAAQTLKGLHSMFLFTDEDSFLADNPLTHEWVDGRGRALSLFAGEST